MCNLHVRARLHWVSCRVAVTAMCASLLLCSSAFLHLLIHFVLCSLAMWGLRVLCLHGVRGVCVSVCVSVCCACACAPLSAGSQPLPVLMLFLCAYAFVSCSVRLGTIALSLSIYMCVCHVCFFPRVCSQIVPLLLATDGRCECL